MLESHKEALLKQMDEKGLLAYGGLHESVLKSFCNCKCGKKFELEEYILIPESHEEDDLLATSNLQLLRQITEKYVTIRIFKIKRQSELAYVVLQSGTEVFCYQFQGDA